MLSLSLMGAETCLSAVQTIMRRTDLMVRGRCDAVEYQRMVLEKVAAARESATALSRLRGPDEAMSLLAPWHRRVKANTRQLSKKKS